MFHLGLGTPHPVGFQLTNVTHVVRPSWLLVVTLAQSYATQ